MFIVFFIIFEIGYNCRRCVVIYIYIFEIDICICIKLGSLYSGILYSDVNE